VTLSEKARPDADTFERVLEAIEEGRTMRQISIMPEMPTYGQLMGWMWRYPEFGQAVILARSAHAHAHVDKLTDLMAEVETGSIPVSTAEFIAGQSKWLAQHLNPDAYGDRKNVKGQVDVNTQFTVISGVPQPHEMKTVKDVNDKS
jgi:hypothetical protein